MRAHTHVVTLSFLLLSACLEKGPVAVQQQASPSSPGFLKINTKPWVKVIVDGTPYGSTPLADQKLSAGPHQLELVNENEGVHERRTIDIVSGETLSLILELK